MWIKHQMYDGDALRPRSAELPGVRLDEDQSLKVI